MSEAELFMIKGILSELEPDSQEKVREVKAQLENILKKSGDEGFVALALVSLELEQDPKKYKEK